MTIKALRERRDALAKELNNLMDSTQNGEWKPEHQAKYDANMKEITACDEQIKRRQAVLDLDAERSFENTLRESGAARNETEMSAITQFLRGGLSSLSTEQLGAMRARQNADILSTYRNAMSTTTGSEGGYTVAQEWATKITEAMKLFGGMRAVATVLKTSTGIVMNFPTADATAEEGEIVGQNVAAAVGNTAFGAPITLGAYRYSSKSIALPWELMTDSNVDIETYIINLLATRIGRIQNRHFTVGTGTNQPTGIVTAATVGKTLATGHTLDFGYDDLVDLEHSVDPIYRNAARYMMHDTSLKVVRKIKDTQGRPIFVPGYEQGNPGGAPDRLMGRTIQINQHMAVPAANAKSIAFGDFSKYLIRDVQDWTLFRMTDSAYTLSGQVGFVGFQRADGNLVDVGGAVKTLQHSAT